MKARQRSLVATVVAITMTMSGVVNAATVTARTTDGKRWEVTYNGKPVCVYNYAPETRKPYIQELHTLRGENLLRDNVADHPHHHGLMYAIMVNGLDYWAETPGSGLQRAAGGVETTSRTMNGRTEASFKHRIHWVAEADRARAGDERNAVLIEDRRLTLMIEEASDEVALRWQSDFRFGGRTNKVELTGREYLGLGMRFLAELDSVTAHNIGGTTPDLSGMKQDVSPAPWGAVTFNKPGQHATIAVFGNPANARGVANYFTMARPFAYLSATQRLDKEPLNYKSGDTWKLDYLVTVHGEIKSTDFLNTRATQWENAVETLYETKETK